MIDQIYIDSAIKIRTEFFQTQKEISECESKTLRLKSDLENQISNLEKIKSKLLKSKETDKDKIEQQVIGEFSKIEKQIGDFAKMIEPLNIKMEELSKREDFLYNTIKEKYPTLSDNDIVEELKKWIKK